MKKRRIIKFLKVSALMFSVLAVVILAIALSDPNFKGFIGKVYNTIVEADYDTSSVLSSETNNSSENKTSSISSEHTSKNSKPEKIEEIGDENLILQEPSGGFLDEACIQCDGLGKVVCPTCNGTGANAGGFCKSCYGDGKVECQYCN